MNDRFRSEVPEVMLELKELLLDLLTLQQSVQSRLVLVDASIIHVAPLGDVAAELAFPEDILEAAALRIVLPVEGIPVGEDIAALGVV